MGDLHEGLAAWIAFGKACWAYWPAIGLSTVVVGAWAKILRSPQLRRWLARRERRHFVTAIIVFGFTVFVSGSAYVDIYKKTNVELGLLVDVDVRDPHVIIGESINYSMYFHNTGNKNILVQEVGFYYMEFNDKEFMGHRDFRQECLSDKAISAIRFVTHSPGPEIMTDDGGVITYYKSPETVTMDGVERRQSFLAINAKTSVAADINTKKYAMDLARANITLSCLVFKIFDVNNESKTIVCKGSFGARLGPNGQRGYLYTGGMPQFKLLPEVDQGICRQLN